MQVVENVALISINATLVVQLISFLIFMVWFNRIMIRPLRKIMTERERFVEKVRTDVLTAGEAFEEMAHQIERQESEARRAAIKVREEFVAAGQRSVADVIDKTRQEIGVLRSDAQKAADASIAAARQSIRAEAEILADHMVASLLNRRSTN
jgi:F-type H+-transporting ATPase subunit b